MYHPVASIFPPSSSNPTSSPLTQFNIDDDSLKEAFKEVGEITNIKWLEDRDTGEFGFGFGFGFGLPYRTRPPLSPGPNRRIPSRTELAMTVGSQLFF